MVNELNQSARTSKITNDRLNPFWYRMLYSCTHMATVDVKELTRTWVVSVVTLEWPGWGSGSGSPVEADSWRRLHPTPASSTFFLRRQSMRTMWLSWILQLLTLHHRLTVHASVHDDASHEAGDQRADWADDDTSFRLLKHDCRRRQIHNTRGRLIRFKHLALTLWRPLLPYAYSYKASLSRYL